MRKPVTVVLALLVAATLVPPAQALPRRAEVQTWKGNLDFPVDMAWARGTNRIFFTEKNTGRVRVMVGRRLLGRPCVRLDVSSAGERGALGIALHPRFKRNRFLYVYYTNRDPLQNRVTRFTVDRNRCTNPRHIVRGLRTHGATNHNAGQLQFVGGKLFVTTGDAAQPAQSQDRSTRLGKILRLNPNGTIPDDNPSFENRAVWAYGLRNPFGITKEPGTRRIFVTDNGPQCDDKLFRARRGRNHGWGPNYQCGPDDVGPNPVRPLIRWSQIIVPTDPVFYKGRFGAMSGSLYVGDFSGRLRRVNLNQNRTQVQRERIVFTARRGIVSVNKGPGGWLYFVTDRAIRRIVRR